MVRGLLLFRLEILDSSSYLVLIRLGLGDDEVLSCITVSFIIDVERGPSSEPGVLDELADDSFAKSSGPSNNDSFLLDHID